MTKDVLVRIRGLQFIAGDVEDDVEPIEMITVGEHYLKNDHHYVKYEEIFEGFTDKTQNMVKIAGDVLEVRKKGLINVHMVFEENKKNISYYTTPFGTMQMGIAATRVKIDKQEDQINIRAEYALEINEGHVGDCCLEMNIISKGGKETGDLSLLA